MERETEAQKEKLICLHAQGVSATSAISTDISCLPGLDISSTHAPKYTVIYSSHLSLKLASVSPISWSLTLVGRLVSVQVGPSFERTASQAHILQWDLRGPSRKRRPCLFKCLFLNL